VRSHIAYPAPHAIDTAKAHGAPLGEQEVRATKLVMGFDPDATFQVQQRVYEHMSLLDSGAAAQQAWERREREWRERYPQLAEEWERAWSGRPRDGWETALPSFPVGEQIATRSAGQKAMAALSAFAPTMVGGAADLVESTKTVFEGSGVYSRVHAGRNIPFGIREHAMGAIVNGLAAHGGMVKPYGSTFLIFSDYMRPSVRLSALMGLPVVWVWTHDSVGLGEDGPTHQPVEHYTALRAIPHLWVIRPADANETAVAWRVALEREDGPVALLLSRQSLPVLDRSQVGAADGLERGGYVLWDSAEGEPELILIATGSEVAPTLQAGRELARLGPNHPRVRVVSMPCMELFEAQPAAYRDGVIPREVPARLAVEAGVSMSWWKWVGDRGGVLGIDRFGASAPGATVLKELGFSPESIAAHASELMDRQAPAPAG
jgi:transketolase